MASNGYIKNSDGSYSVNYDDQRFKDVQAEQTQKEAQIDQTYNNMISESDKHYNNQIQATKDYATQQSELQQANTNFAIQQIEQQKEQVQKDYTREQKGAYVDYMKQTKSNAQNIANNGLTSTGYSESSLVSIYNTYQNRVASAKDSLNRSILNYNNSITQAQLANNERLAEIAFNALQTQNQLSQQAFEYKNSLILQKENALQQINDTYYARYQDVLSQINSEISLRMELDRIDREYDQWLREFNEKRNQWQKEYSLKEREVNAQISASKAQESYYYAQTQAKSGNSNPYGSAVETNLSTSGKQLLGLLQGRTVLGKNITKTLKTNEQRKEYIANAVNSGLVTNSDAEIIWNKLGY